MQIGPRYKKARYLGAPVFKKTQTQKYALRSQNRGKNSSGKRRGNKSEYGRQMLEKQKARYSYGVSGGQFSRYVEMALKGAGDNSKNLLRILEGRLDNVVLRAGFTQSRSASRQMVSHGHMCVNGCIITIPSYQVRIGDVITIRQGSVGKAIFTKLGEELKVSQPPAWISVDAEKKTITIEGQPTVDTSTLLFDIGSVLEFYTR